MNINQEDIQKVYSFIEKVFEKSYKKGGIQISNQGNAVKWQLFFLQLGILKGFIVSAPQFGTDIEFEIIKTALNYTIENEKLQDFVSKRWKTITLKSKEYFEELLIYNTKSINARMEKLIFYGSAQEREKALGKCSGEPSVLVQYLIDDVVVMNEYCQSEMATFKEAIQGVLNAMGKVLIIQFRPYLSDQDIYDLLFTINNPNAPLESLREFILENNVALQRFFQSHAFPKTARNIYFGLDFQKYGQVYGILSQFIFFEGDLKNDNRNWETAIFAMLNQERI